MQNETNSNHGGARVGAGRKSVSGEPAKSRTVRLTDAEWADFQALGGVDMLRKLIQEKRADGILQQSKQ